MENKENAVTTLPFEDSLPDWFDGKRINEVLFCQQFLEKHPMKCVRGRLFTVDGLIEDKGLTASMLPMGRISWTDASPATRAIATTA